MNRQIVRDIVNLQRDVSSMNDEIPDAGLTLTRTATQAITTAGTILVWQSRIRGQGITWAGSDVVIPADGWYLVSVSIQTTTALNDLLYRLIVGGVVVRSAAGVGDVDRNNTSAMFMRYFSRGSSVQIQLIPSANTTVALNAEGSLESPIFHIVQLTNQAEV